MWLLQVSEVAGNHLSDDYIWKPGGPPGEGNPLPVTRPITPNQSKGAANEMVPVIVQLCVPLKPVAQVEGTPPFPWLYMGITVSHMYS